MLQANKYALAIRSELSQQRRQLGASSPEAFSRIYLTAHCVSAFSRMHTEVFKKLATLTENRSSRLAIAAPRGHAKSTIVSLAYVLWSVLYGKERFVLLVSATREQVVLLLKTIKDELQQNSLLLEDFPKICIPKGVPGQPKPWRDNRILLPNGAMISAYGAGQGLRGAKNESHRPGLIIVDDIENYELVISEEQRQKLKDWFTGTLLHSGHPGTNVVVVGTVLHHDSLLANLINPDLNHGWTGMLYKAVEEFSDHPNLWDKWSGIFRAREEFNGQTGSEAARQYYESKATSMDQGVRVLWPERESYYDLMVMREREGQAAFQSEKQNEPIDPEQCIFNEQNFHYWDDEYNDVEHLLKALGDGYFFGACDPSLGRRTGRGDYTAILIVFVPEDSQTRYVIVADISRRSPDQTIEQIIRYAKMYDLLGFIVESNHFQEVMVDNLRRRVQELNVALPFYPLSNRSNKQSRIASLEPAINQGLIRFYRCHQLLLDQLRQFPLGRHDDGPDALEMVYFGSGRIDLPQDPPVIHTIIPQWAREQEARRRRERY